MLFKSSSHAVKITAQLIVSLLFFISIVSKAQVKKVAEKVPSGFVTTLNSIPSSEKRLFRIMVEGTERTAPLQLQKFNPIKIAAYEMFSFYMITATSRELLDTVLPIPDVLFAEDGTRMAKEESQINNLDLGTNNINTVHALYPQWNGDGLTVSVKENLFDTNDIDFTGRYIRSPLSSPVVNAHATIMATMIAGAGNSWYTGRGAAWASKITSSDFSNLLPDPNNVLQQNNITVQNHSYGVGIENFYGGDAVAYDASLIANPTLLNIFSSGNSGLLTSSGNYAGIPGYANLTGSFKMAKNIITVGATDSFSKVAIQSSKGPAYDGRVKPDMVAFGIDGSSGSAALVSGVSLLLQQQYKALQGSVPANALIKAVLLNSADDTGNKEVDFSSGFGSLNALNAIRTIADGRYRNGTITNNGIQQFPLSIPAGVNKVKVTLVWNDAAANVNATSALINDLDLELINTTTNQLWRPWVLNSFPHTDSLNQLATRKRDSINNVEQVTLDNPVSGTYQVSIKGTRITSSSQAFYIAYQFDSSQVFEWHFPTRKDPVFSGDVNTLRWHSSYTAASGILDYSIDNGATWQLIDATADLSKGYYNWQTPMLTSNALLRITAAGRQFISDTFLISSRPQTGVGFNCPDSFLIYWNKLPVVNSYRVYQLGSRYMEPILQTTDTLAVLKKNTNPSLYYAVAPLVAGKEGIRSYTFNYTLQGVDCYIKSFLAALVDNSAELTVVLGTRYNIDKIVLEKFDGTTFKLLQQLVNNSNLAIKLVDNNLVKGLNIYRIKIELTGGAVVYSLLENVFYFKESGYVIYPNPAAQNSEINIAQQNVDLALMQIFNASGVKVYEKQLDDRINKIASGILSKGFYILRITTIDKQIETMKLVVY